MRIKPVQQQARNLAQEPQPEPSWLRRETAKQHLQPRHSPLSATKTSSRTHYKASLETTSCRQVLSLHYHTLGTCHWLKYNSRKPQEVEGLTPVPLGTPTQTSSSEGLPGQKGGS